jgi:hypothetical protein
MTANPPSVDPVCIDEETNKHSPHHDRFRRYERMFLPFQHEPIDPIEIGIFRVVSTPPDRSVYRAVGIRSSRMATTREERS